MIEGLRRLLGAFVLVGVCAAQPAWFVDGRRGADVPSGGSAASPWKTIGYALATMPVPRPPGFHVLYVAGGQVYGAESGEDFPIRMRDAIAVVGIGMPVVDVPASATGFVFHAQQSYGRASGLIGVDVRGNDVVIKLGSAAGQRHAPSFHDCRLGAVLTLTRGDDAPRFHRCSVISAARIGTLKVHASGVGVCEPLVSECRVLSPISSPSLRFVASPPAMVRGEIVGCSVEGPARFERASTRIRHSDLQSWMPVTIDEIEEGATMVVEHCRLAGDGSLHVQMSAATSSTILVLRHCLFLGGDGGAAVMLHGGSRVLSFGNRYAGGYGQLLHVTQDTNAPGAGFISERDHFTDGSLYPISIEARGSAGGAALLSGVVDGAALHTWAISVRGTRPVSVRGMTVIRNGSRTSGGGLEVTNPATTIDHCIFADNVPAEISVPVGVVPRYSLFKTQSVAGPGNLNLVDPRLLPGYRLDPSSPCIDAGDPAMPLTGIDFDGDPRTVGSRVDLGADEFVPGGSLRSVGIGGYAPGGFLPEIGPNGAPARIGTPMTITLAAARSRDGVGALGAALFVGAEQLAQPIARKLSYTHLQPAWHVASRAVDGQGSAISSLTLPNDAALVGRSFAAQWFVVTPAFDLASTQALRITFGR